MKMKMEMELKILKQALGAILDEDPHIFPEAIVGKYESRTDFMEGWNQGVAAGMILICSILDDLGIDVEDGDNCLDTPEIIIY